jgi:hypothetical protein
MPPRSASDDGRGCLGSVRTPYSSSRGRNGRTVTTRAAMESCVTSCSTARSSTRYRRPGCSSNDRDSIATPSVHTAPCATGHWPRKPSCYDELYYMRSTTSWAQAKTTSSRCYIAVKDQINVPSNRPDSANRGWDTDRVQAKARRHAAQTGRLHPPPRRRLE